MAPELSTKWCKNMSYAAKKSFSRSVWVIALGALFLAGCEDEGSSSVEGSDAESSEEDRQDTASAEDNIATLTWDAPMQRENGDSLSIGAIDNYRVSWGKNPDELENSTDVSCSSCADMEYVVEDLDDGEWYFTVQTVDTEGNVSRRADPVSKQI